LHALQARYLLQQVKVIIKTIIENGEVIVGKAVSSEDRPNEDKERNEDLFQKRLSKINAE